MRCHYWCRNRRQKGKKHSFLQETAAEEKNMNLVQVIVITITCTSDVV